MSGETRESIYSTSRWVLVSIVLVLGTVTAMMVLIATLDDLDFVGAWSIGWMVAAAIAFARLLSTKVVLTDEGELRGHRLVGSTVMSLGDLRSATIIPSRPPLLRLRGDTSIFMFTPIDGLDDLVARMYSAKVLVDDDLLRQPSKYRGKVDPTRT